MIGLHIEVQPIYEPDELDAQLVDGTSLTLCVTEENGTFSRRSVSQALADEILELLEDDIKRLAG